jgi:MerR family transcriptional regulator/heat shock protein HspR
MVNKPASTEPIYTLAIASKLSGIPLHSIRQYIEKGLVIPFRTIGNRHLFSDVDIKRLKCIKHYLQDEKINVAGIKAMFSLIPCWLLKPCSSEDRINCDAYHSSSEPCWEASQKSLICKTSDCRLCSTYRFPEGCDNLKDLFKKLLDQDSK